MLTRSQKRALDFIVTYQAANGGVSPTYQELIDFTGEASKSAAYRCITALEERGFIRRIPGKARAVEVLRLSSGQLAHSYAPGANSRLPAFACPPTNRDVTLPAIGKPPRAIRVLCPAGRVS